MQVRSFRQHALAFAVAAAFPPCVLAQTLPTGGEVRPEQASIFQTSPTSLHIQQHADKAILNWQSFSIGAGAQVNFQQPSSSSIALNRVLGNNPSQIFGHLGANGRVFLVNPSGIFFGPGSSANVGALVASTLSIADDDFLAGRYTFSNAGGAGSILNQGNLFSHSGYTALLAPQVTNEGFIFANLGSVALAAGDRVTLDMVGDNLIRVNVDQATLDAAVVNRGSIEAFGGNVLLTAHSANAVLDTVLNTEGIVRAFGMTEQDGQIVLHGGSRGTTALGGEVFSGGAMTIDGDAVVITAGGGRDALVGASQGQTVNARSLAVSAADGNNVTLSSFGAGQTFNVTGGSFDVKAAGGGFIDIASHGGGNQTIAVRDGDHFDVHASDASRIFLSVPQGTQTHSIAGGDRNAMTYRAEGAASLFVSGNSQHFIAGVGNQSGSISVAGPDADGAMTQISAFPSLPGQGEQSISTSGALTVVGGSRATGLAFLTGFVHGGQGAQAISAASMEMRGGAGGAGNPASILSVSGGEQRVQVTGDLVLLGGPGGLTELFSSGPQQINAANILLRGGSGGANNGAFISTNPGVSQHIEVPGQIVLVAGDSNNGAGIIGRGIQTIVGRPDIRMAGGAGGNATIQGLGGLQRIEAHDIFLTNAESSPVNSAGVILGSLQRIDATGDVTLVARSGTGTSSGVRIGAAGAGATDLVLTVDGNVVLTGGTSGTNGAGLGGAGSGPTSDNNVTVIAQGDVILDGALGGAGARIGSSALTPVQEGNISVTARNIRFTGSAPAAIRSLGNVELHAEQAGGTIAQDANGFILADALATTSSGSTSLAGANQVSSFNGTSWFGDVMLNNAGALEVTGVSAANASLTNAGPVTISGWWNSFGDTSIATSGAGSDLLVTNSVFAGGAMNVDVSGSLAVIATGGAGASLNSIGHQSVAISAGNIEVLAPAGGFAGIIGGSQAISIVDGDYLRIVGDLDGFAQVLSIDGSQAVSLAGSGDNAIIVGRQGGSGFSTLNAATQNITAGLGGQSGSITILGGDGGMFPFATIAARGEGGQTVSSSGKISVIGGSASFGTGATGFFNDGPGQQTVRAGSIELRGGPAGTGPGVFMNSNGGGDQIIDVSGDIDVIGGTGRNASISVNPLFSTRQAKQTIGAANIRIAAGLGANAAIASSAGGDQLITLSGDLEIAGAPSGIAIVNSVGGDGLQTISARSIDISNAGGSGNSVGVIQGSHQRITASGNVTLTASSAGGELAAARIGSPTDRATDLELVVGGDLVLTGGTAGLNGAALGGSVLGAVLDNDITVGVGGDLVLDGGAGGAGVRIGSSERIGLGDGDISITARNIHFVGSEPAAIRTLGNVALNAGEIRQAPNGLILANALTTSSEGSTLLTGSNNVSSFGGSAGGNLLLRNLSSFLTLGTVGVSGALSIDQAGSLLIQATDAPLVVRGGLVNVATGGDFRLVGGDADGAHALLSSGGNIDLTVGGTLRLDEGAGKFSWAKVQTESRDGVISLSFPNLSSGGFYVNGVEGDTKDGKSGFFIVHRPAKIGRDLLIDYQE